MKPSMNLATNSAAQTGQGPNSGTSGSKPNLEKPSLSTDIETVKREGDYFKDFIFSGRVSLTPDGLSSNVNILRDTASAQSLIVKDALPNIEQSYTGEQVIVLSMFGRGPVPLAYIYIDNDLVKGWGKVGVVEDSLPVSGVTFLLSNNLAGSLTVPCPIMLQEPMISDNSESEFYPACAVTRSQSREVNAADESDFNLSELFSEGSREDFKSLPMTRDNLLRAQRSDSSLKTAFENAVEKIELLKGTGYYIDNI